MSKIIVTKKEKELAPEGVHIARCYQIIHIGTVMEPYMGEMKETNKVMLSFELSNEKRVFNPDKGEQPFSVSKEFTLSLGDKSNLKKFLENWRGKQFTQIELENFDVAQVLGKFCFLNIIHKTAKSSGNQYVDISSITPLPKGTEIPVAINDAITFGYDPFDVNIFNGFPEWLKEKIAKSKEYKALEGGQAGDGLPKQVPDMETLPF